MPERDWERDWEICKKATPGPWRNKVWYCKTRVLNDGKCCFCGNANGVLVHEETDSEGERYHIHEFPDSDWRTIWSVSKFCRVVGTCDYEEGGVCTSEDDALFVAEARTGWPAALRERARLEKRVKELEKVLIEVWCICRQRAPRSAKLLAEVKQVIRTALEEQETDE